MTSCADCGAALGGNDTCHSLFERLLAHEYQLPAAFGAVHHITVAAYSLQHPAGYSRDAIRMWRVIIAESLDGTSTPANFLERARAQFSGGLRVRERGAVPPEWWPRSWPMTAADVVAPPDETESVEGHVQRVRQWASAIRTTLDTVDPVS